ncbi:MAG: DUF3800 domain-containing protein [Rhodobacteraceae bacterium]|nr:DUF3800 domain-containing protein [Paracoccaceae bacterium]
MSDIERFVRGRSLGGGPLPSGGIVRHVYLDEAGISQNGVEPYLVVAAAITNPDRHWHDIVNYYDVLAEGIFDNYSHERDGHFIFHAKDVWHGCGLFPRETFSLQERMRIFRQLAQAPDLLAIPICIGILDKGKIAFRDGTSDAAKMSISHAIAFNLAMQDVDWWMEEHCTGQIAMVTAEDTPVVKKALQLFHASPQTDGRGYTHENTNVFMTRSIVDSINFSVKRSSPIMQMADHCAFIARRSLTDCKFIGEYKKMIDPAIYAAPTSRRILLLRLSLEVW